MSNFGFKSRDGSSKHLGDGGSAEGPDKIDMSLDDIIRLNRREQQTLRSSTGGRKTLANSRLPNSRLPPGRRFGVGPSQRGGGVMRPGGRGRWMLPAAGRRRGQGVITGLAARRSAAIRKGISPLNRPTVTQRPRPLLPRRPGQFRQMDAQHRRQYRLPGAQRGPNTAAHRPVQLRRPNVTTNQQAQREARQATFLFRRGLKVQAQVSSPAPPPPAAHWTDPWSSPTTSSRVLTISIDNQTARTQPEPPRAWTLYPPAVPPLTVKQEEEERKPSPKGVPLQFDINSVGKQTSMTLNERFRILKDRRVAAAQSTKAGRFVTVG